MQVIAVHDVDDVKHWFNSPERSKFFEARGMRATAFRDPAGHSTTVAVLIETPDIASLEAALATPEAKGAEEHDGVHVETITLFVDASGGFIMTTTQYEQAIAEFRRVLEDVTPDQLDGSTPCASFNVAQLIDHTIGTQHMVTDALQDEPFNMAGVEMAPAEQAAAFELAAADAVAELRRDGVLDKTVEMPFGTFSAGHLMDLCALDTYQHAWDLAKATGQDSDLDRQLADALMIVAKGHMAHAPRGDEPAPYGPEQTAPEGAPKADQLAAFLGRTV